MVFRHLSVTLIRLLLLFSLVFNCVGELRAQKSKPDFTGTWNARLLADPNAPIKLLKISYNDPRLEIERILIEPKPPRSMGFNPSSRNFVFYTDGRGETQKPLIPDKPGDSSKTQRVGEKFVTTVSSTESGKEVTSVNTITFEVSSDGKLLSETFTLVSEGNTSNVVRLYDRVSGATTRDINGEWKQRLSDQLISLVVEHHDPEIKVTRRVVTEAQDKTEISVYYTDGRGEINVRDGRPLKSITKWKGQNLSFSSSRKSKGDGITLKTNESIKWEISSSGQSLIEITETKMSLNEGYMSSPKASKLIYARSSRHLPD
ncbi:MAG TPA: hypothetical protein VFS90_04215 [Pyrinomonadaceae bacterium]|nr:hypothetical protein [Pyrinomonadaceae bacterium]